MTGFTGELKKRIRRKDTLLFGCIMDSRSGSAVGMYREFGFDAIMIDRDRERLTVRVAEIAEDFGVRVFLYGCRFVLDASASLGYRFSP